MHQRSQLQSLSEQPRPEDEKIKMDEKFKNYLGSNKKRKKYLMMCNVIMYYIR